MVGYEHSTKIYLWALVRKLSVALPDNHVIVKVLTSATRENITLDKSYEVADIFLRFLFLRGVGFI